MNSTSSKRRDTTSLPGCGSPVSPATVTLGTLIPRPALVRGAIVGGVMIVFMTYAAMPAATRIARRWLY